MGDIFWFIMVGFGLFHSGKAPKKSFFKGKFPNLWVSGVQQGRDNLKLSLHLQTHKHGLRPIDETDDGGHVGVPGGGHRLLLLLLLPQQAAGEQGAQLQEGGQGTELEKLLKNIKSFPFPLNFDLKLECRTLV